MTTAWMLAKTATFSLPGRDFGQRTVEGQTLCGGAHLLPLFDRMPSALISSAKLVGVSPTTYVRRWQRATISDSCHPRKVSLPQHDTQATQPR